MPLARKMRVLYSFTHIPWNTTPTYLLSPYKATALIGQNALVRPLCYQCRVQKWMRLVGTIVTSFWLVAIAT